MNINIFIDTLADILSEMYGVELKPKEEWSG